MKLTTTFLSEALSLITAALLILWLTASPHLHIPQPGNECRANTSYEGYFYEPCTKVRAFEDPVLWWNEGQDV